MTDNTNRSLEAIDADIATATRQREAILAERAALIEQIEAGAAKDTAKGQAALLTVDYDVLTKRLDRLQEARYEATKAALVDGYREKQQAVVAARATSKVKLADHAELLQTIERLKKEAVLLIGGARKDTDQAVIERRDFLQNAAEDSGYGQKLLDDCAAAIAAIELEFGEGAAVNRANAEAYRRAREEDRMAAKAEKQQRYDDNWAAYNGIRGKAQQ